MGLFCVIVQLRLYVSPGFLFVFDTGFPGFHFVFSVLDSVVKVNTLLCTLDMWFVTNRLSLNVGKTVM